MIQCTLGDQVRCGEEGQHLVRITLEIKQQGPLVGLLQQATDELTDEILTTFDVEQHVESRPERPGGGIGRHAVEDHAVQSLVESHPEAGSNVQPAR